METNKIHKQFQIAKFWPFIALAGFNFNAFATEKAPDKYTDTIIVDDMFSTNRYWKQRNCV